MFDRWFSRRQRNTHMRVEQSSRGRSQQESAPHTTTTQPLSSSTSSNNDHTHSHQQQDIHLSPRASMSSLPSYHSRDRDLPGYQYDVGHPLSTLNFLTTQAATTARNPHARIPLPSPPPHPALCLAPYTAHGSPWRDVPMSFGWIWMPSRAVKAHRRLIPHDHPVYHMSPSEQSRLRRMGIDPVAKAEFLMLQR